MDVYVFTATTATMLFQFFRSNWNISASKRAMNVCRPSIVDKPLGNHLLRPSPLHRPYARLLAALINEYQFKWIFHLHAFRHRHRALIVFIVLSSASSFHIPCARKSFRFVFFSRSRLIINSFGIFLRFSFFARCASWTRDGDGEATLSRGFFITWENNCTPFAVATLKYLWWRWQQQHAIIYGLWCY